jgi:hypothetical protein
MTAYPGHRVSLTSASEGMDKSGRPGSVVFVGGFEPTLHSSYTVLRFRARTRRGKFGTSTLYKLPL